MKKQHTFIVIAIFVLLAVLLLLFSTKIALFISGFHMEKNPADTIAQNNDVKAWVDRFTSPEGIFKAVEVNGWAINPSHSTETEKHITVILKAADYYYEVKTEVYNRPDLVEHFTDLKLDERDLGYKAVFSTLAVEDGEYELFVKLWQGNEEASFISLNRFFKQVDGVFTELRMTP